MVGKLNASACILIKIIQREKYIGRRAFTDSIVVVHGFFFIVESLGMGLWAYGWKKVILYIHKYGKVKARGSPLYCEARRVDVYACEVPPILKMIYIEILLNILCRYMKLDSGSAILSILKNVWTRRS